jgi:hypothetical protein
MQCIFAPESFKVAEMQPKSGYTTNAPALQVSENPPDFAEGLLFQPLHSFSSR